MKRYLITIVAAATVVVCASPAYSQTADIPAAIPYQGHLTDAGGVDVNDAVQIEVRLYDSLIAGLGQGVTNSHVVYAETQPAVAVEKGNFSVAIGEGIPLDAKWVGLPDVAELISKERLFLELRVNGELMMPRQRLGSVPAVIRAHHAKVADEITNLTSIPAGKMPAYAAERLTEGQLSVSRIPGFAASVVTGTLSQGNLPATIDVSMFDESDRLTQAQLPGLSAASITSGIVGAEFIPSSQTYMYGDVVAKIGTLIHGQHLSPPTGFDLNQDCKYLISPVETSGAVEGIDKMLTYIDSNTENLFCRVYGGINDNNLEWDGIMCNAHYMMLCKRED